jgi:hypothetical protein
MVARKIMDRASMRRTGVGVVVGTKVGHTVGELLGVLVG